MGDDFFAGVFPFVDLGSGGSVQGLAANVGKVLGLLPAGVKVIPGHGALSTADGLKEFHAMLAESLALVKGKIAAGKTKEQVQAEGMPEKLASWGKGFIDTKTWLGIVYESLKGQGAHDPSMRHH